MSGCPSSMLYNELIQSRHCARLVLCAMFLMAWSSPSFAQTVAATGSGSGVGGPAVSTGSSIGAGGPPPDISLNKLPAKDPNAIAVDGWLLYPTVRLYSLYYHDKLLPDAQQCALGGRGRIDAELGGCVEQRNSTQPRSTAISSRQDYPSNNGINTLDGRAGFTQRYEAMRDLIFTLNGNYAHQTLNHWPSKLDSDSRWRAPVTAVLPNGNTQLPNGTILSPTGQVGRSGGWRIRKLASVGKSILPNQLTGTFTIDKLFSRAALSLSASINRTEYENQSVTPNFNSRTLTENASAWLGPLIYAYSSGSVTTTTDDAFNSPTGNSPSLSTTSYRVIGGLGTRLAETICRHRLFWTPRFRERWL